jgi:hypothetical protein
MTDEGARIMGGMTKEEAREFLKKIGFDYKESEMKLTYGKVPADIRKEEDELEGRATHRDPSRRKRSSLSQRAIDKALGPGAHSKLSKDLKELERQVESAQAPDLKEASPVDEFYLLLDETIAEINQHNQVELEIVKITHGERGPVAHLLARIFLNSQYFYPLEIPIVVTSLGAVHDYAINGVPSHGNVATGIEKLIRSSANRELRRQKSVVAGWPQPPSLEKFK